MFDLGATCIHSLLTSLTPPFFEILLEYSEMPVCFYSLHLLKKEDLRWEEETAVPFPYGNYGHGIAVFSTR